jgi:sec-independent protein translocase protein TatB
MELFGVGFSELVFVLIIALLVLGPKDMEKTGRMIGQWLNRMIHSDGWKAFQQLRNLPNKLMRDANIEKFSASPPQERHGTAAGASPRPQPFASKPAAPAAEENKIAPATPETPQPESDPQKHA